MGFRENQFSEGVALGLALAGYAGLPHDKVGIELAFRSAWRSWPHASKFPFVGARSRANELYQMTDAGRRHHTTYLYWDGMEILRASTPYPAHPGRHRRVPITPTAGAKSR